ncbi:hypothetical protein P7K49_020666 [Saguinus oedipus]|uniref:Matrix metalloproteinase-17 n=1 Tax=Saguinus oedipus TaxID=9490 RepID=A0ABQ9V1X9_SAGOE|nr:hypothetical protein P7K49_020666 [Saguinus oedipus]
MARCGLQAAEAGEKERLEPPAPRLFLSPPGDRYWLFKDNNVEEGYPRPVSDFSLPPGGIDAAFSWAYNDRTYFFKDQLYWRYDDHTRRMDPGYPAQSPLWRGVPSTLDDAMRWSDGEHRPRAGRADSDRRRVPARRMAQLAGCRACRARPGSWLARPHPCRSPASLLPQGLDACHALLRAHSPEMPTQPVPRQLWPCPAPSWASPLLLGRDSPQCLSRPPLQFSMSPAPSRAESTASPAPSRLSLPPAPPPAGRVYLQPRPQPAESSMSPAPSRLIYRQPRPQTAESTASPAPSRQIYRQPRPQSAESTASPAPSRLIYRQPRPQLAESTASPAPSRTESTASPAPSRLSLPPAPPPAGRSTASPAPRRLIYRQPRPQPAESTAGPTCPPLAQLSLSFSGASYFFRGQEYWKVLDGELEAAPGYPQSTARDWLVCGDSQADGSEAAGVDGAEGGRAPPGQHHQSRSEDGYEVCSCTSRASSLPGAPGPLGAAATLLLLLPPPLSPGALLWTVAQALAL